MPLDSSDPKYKCQQHWESLVLKKRITVRAVDEEVIDMLSQLREEEGRFIGRILSDAVRDYWDDRAEEEEVFEGLD